ncbi:MAG: hypothetical protein JO159_05285 [Acidobacteria bacterium]|nr:hypothetical protein [Acidobacteriota bacterium]
MSSSIPAYPVVTRYGTRSRIAVVLRRAPLIMMLVIFSLISVKYLSNPIAAAAAVGISFTSPGGITIARVGFAAFPLSMAILAFASLLSTRWRLAGLYMVLTVDAVVMGVRIFGTLVDHSTASAHLLAPEAVLLGLSTIAIRLEAAAQRATNSAETRNFVSENASHE